jgi:hypothetical protein
MRYVPALMTALILGGTALSAPASAASIPAPAASAFGPSPVTVETVGYWRKYCKFNDCTGNANVDVTVEAPVATENPPIIAIQPARPVSCGEFHYWNGSACVDARYNNPYLGPR